MSWRVGSRGLRIVHADGSETVLPPGSLIPDIPDRFDGSLELVREDRPYDDKAVIYGDYEVK